MNPADHRSYVGSLEVMSQNGLFEILPIRKVKPQFLQSYLSPSDKPGVSQVILQAGQVANGRSVVRLSVIEFSVCIVAPIIRNDGGFKKRTITQVA